MDLLDQEGKVVASSRKEGRIGIDEGEEGIRLRAHHFSKTINAGFSEVFARSIVYEDDESALPMFHVTGAGFHCGHSVCDLGTKDFCRQTPDDTGGAPIVECNIAPTGCDPASCACLTAETTACSGTCVDGSNGPTITCPGG